MRRKIDAIIPAMLALIDLPPDLARLLERQAEIAAMKRETVTIPQPADLVMSGKSLAEARQEVAEAKSRADAVDPTPLDQAADSLHRRISNWIVENCDDLIQGPVRDKVVDLLEAAGKPAETLADYFPQFDPGKIIATGNASHLKAWQSSRDINQQLEDIRRGWFRIYRQAVSKPRPDRPRQEFTPTRPGGVHVWRNPELVSNVKVRDGVLGDILTIAPFRDNYRLASPSEILRLSKKHHLYKPMRGYRPGPALEIETPVTSG